MIHNLFDPRDLTEIALPSYDVVSKICQTLGEGTATNGGKARKSVRFSVPVGALGGLEMMDVKANGRASDIGQVAVGSGSGIGAMFGGGLQVDDRGQGGWHQVFSPPPAGLAPPRHGGH